jgi:hypothetical protein
MKKLLLVPFLAAFLTLGAVSPADRNLKPEETESRANRSVPSEETEPPANPSVQSEETETSADRGVQPEDRESPDPEAFPIMIDFQCPRNFGFHVGDDIPLTVTLEAREGIIVDLVNLPQKGEAHGPFEVRDLRIQKSQSSNRTIYTVHYRLQSFMPAIAVDKLSFPPLRISYATKDDWNPVESKYHYRGLFSQPFDVFVSRTATYFGPMKAMKGPMEDETLTVMWKVATVAGSLLVLVALITWPWEFIRRRRSVSKPGLSFTASDRALKALQQARESCFNYEDHRKRLFFEMNAILRDFLKEACGLTSANRPSMEIMNQLQEQPCYEELTGLVARINQVIYEGDAPVDVESIVRQFTGLLQKINGTTPGVNHDKAG